MKLITITHFLLELGKGFEFIGRQYHLEEIEQDLQHLQSKEDRLWQR